MSGARICFILVLPTGFGRATALWFGGMAKDGYQVWNWLGQTYGVNGLEERGVEVMVSFRCKALMIGM